jgi:integrase/recombinase XerD
MLRDTFAVEYLLAGMPLQEVSRLLGHSIVLITQKHYAPWVLERQQRLATSVHGMVDDGSQQCRPGGQYSGWAP